MLKSDESLHIASFVCSEPKHTLFKLTLCKINQLIVSYVVVRRSKSEPTAEESFQ